VQCRADGPIRSLEESQERDDVVPGGLLDLVDPRRVGGRERPALRRRLLDGLARTSPPPPWPVRRRSSTSSQVWYRCSGVQSATISGRLYRGIIALL